jgi:hypothetical protein
LNRKNAILVLSVSCIHGNTSSRPFRTRKALVPARRSHCSIAIHMSAQLLWAGAVNREESRQKRGRREGRGDREKNREKERKREKKREKERDFRAHRRSKLCLQAARAAAAAPTPRPPSSPWQHCHSTRSLTAIGCHVLGIHILILLPLLPLSVKMAASPPGVPPSPNVTTASTVSAPARSPADGAGETPAPAPPHHARARARACRGVP